MLTQASAGKLTPVKLEAPTAKELPPFNPILPPSAISQILLVANPNKVTYQGVFWSQISISFVLHALLTDMKLILSLF